MNMNVCENQQYYPRNREERRRQQRELRKRDNSSPFGRLAREKMEDLIEIVFEGDPYIVQVGDEQIELLADRISKYNKELKPWSSKKETAQILAASYHRLAEKARSEGNISLAEMYDKRSLHTAGCGSSLIFASYIDENGEKHMTPLDVHACHDPLCPVCEWHGSVQRTAVLMETMNRISDMEDVRLLHLVLTVPNVAPDELGETLRKMHAGLANLRQQTWWKRRILGYYAKTEYTWSTNPEMIKVGRTLHPHMHLLLVVPADYFKNVPAWMKNLQDTFNAIGYNPRRSASRCKTLESSVSSLHAAVGKKLFADMKVEQTEEELKIKEECGSISEEAVAQIKSRLFSKYRKRFWRMVKHIDEIADDYRVLLTTDPGNEKAIIKKFAETIADAADPLYIDEPRQHVFLNAWRNVMNDPRITDVQINAVTTKHGQNLNGSSAEAQLDAVKELSKYVCKSCDFLFPNDPDETDRRVEVLLRETKDIRMISSGGIIAKVIAEVKNDWKMDEESCEDEDIEGEGEEDLVGADPSAEIVVATWSQELHAYTVVRYPMTSDALDAIEYLRNIRVPKRIRAKCRDVLTKVQAA